MRSVFYTGFLCIGLFACKKNNSMGAAPYRNVAVINGVNPCTYPCVVNCPCACGDLYFHFTDTTYINNIPVDNPEIFNLPMNAKFPVYVKVNWTNTTRCNTFAIKITAFQFE
jgi:ubiquitin C-terminal hydrolase